MEKESSTMAYCGLFCANCSRYKKGKCVGCARNDKLTWCKIRTCCREKQIASCAACSEYPNVKDCKTYNNLPSRVIEFFAGTDRSLCIAYMRSHTLEEYEAMMLDRGKMSLPKKRK